MDTKRKEKLTKFFGESPGEILMKAEIKAMHEEQKEEKRERREKDRRSRIVGKEDALSPRLTSERASSPPLAIPSGPFASIAAALKGSHSPRNSLLGPSPSKGSPGPSPPKSPSNASPASYDPSKISIRIGDFVPEPGSDTEKLLLDFLEKIDQAKNSPILPPHGIAFGIRRYTSFTKFTNFWNLQMEFNLIFNLKRGECTPPCPCDCYVFVGTSGETGDLKTGGPCSQCGHYPVQHKHLGRSVFKLKSQVEKSEWNLPNYWDHFKLNSTWILRSL